MPNSKAELSLADWHQRYLQQAEWTAEIRRHLFEKAGLKPGNRVLEVGCGTGAVLSRIATENDFTLTGIDIDYAGLDFTQKQNSKFNLAQADGHLLPFADGLFDIVYCHYLLLWVTNPLRVLAEMKRVTRPGGAVIALAEPDHAARIDFPPPLDELGRLQTAALASQGAEVSIGRRVKDAVSADRFGERHKRDSRCPMGCVIHSKTRGNGLSFVRTYTVRLQKTKSTHLNPLTGKPGPMVNG